MDVLIATLPLVTFLIAFLCSQAGISGAFLMLPYQFSVVGIVDPTVNSTNLLYNIIAIPGGVYRYAREGRFLWTLSLVTLFGTVPGIFVGSALRVFVMYDVNTFRMFMAAVLLYLGLRLAYTAVSDGNRASRSGEIEQVSFGFREVSFKYGGKFYFFSPLRLFIVSFSVGIVGGAYGVGGGALLTPYIVGVLGLPVHAVAGATLFGTLVTSVVGVVSYSLLGYPPNLLVGILMGTGGLLGTYAGARTQKYVPEKIIKLFLSALVLALAVKYMVLSS